MRGGAAVIRRKFKEISGLLSLPVIAVVLFLCLAVSAGRSNVLISKDYLEGQFKEELLRYTDNKVAGIEQFAESNINARLGLYQRLAPASFEGLTKSTSVVRIPEKSSITIARGSFFSINSEAGVSHSGLLDLTAGKSLSKGSVSGEKTNTYSLYLVTEGEAVVSTNEAAELYINGWYKVGDLTHFKFKDVKQSAWYYDAVSFVYEHGLFEGTDSATFAPDTIMTRAMFVTVLYRFAGKPRLSDDTQKTFGDIQDPGSYYYDAVLWAAANGIAEGYSDGTFHPGAEVTREQMAAFMYRFAKLGEIAPYTDEKAAAFPDWNDVSGYAREPMAWACANGIINGADGKLLPKEGSRRSHVATIIMNYAGVFSAG